MGKYKLTLLLKIAKISKQGYYYQVKHLDDKDNKDQLIYTKIKKYMIKIIKSMNHRELP